MAIGKNKRLTKSKKGSRKKAVDPFLKKEWYNLMAPAIFTKKNFGKTIITKTQGTKIASDGLKGRVVELSLADLSAADNKGPDKEDMSYRKIKLCVEDVQGYDCLTNFHGMDMTRDKLCSLIKKWQSILEANVDVRTTDGYIIRMFCIAFTQKHKNQLKKTSYCNSAQERAIRAKMVSIMSEEASKGDLRSLVRRLIVGEVLGKQIEKATTSIFPIKDCYIRKVKVLKKPKFDVTDLMEWHKTDTEDVGTSADPSKPVEVAGAGADPEVNATVAGSGGRL